MHPEYDWKLFLSIVSKRPPNLWAETKSYDAHPLAFVCFGSGFELKVQLDWLL